MIDLQKEAERVHQANIKWWQNPQTGLPVIRNKREMLALVISELSECLEGERKNLQDDKLPNRKMAEVEMADAVIRMLDYAGGFKLTLLHPDSRPAYENKAEWLFYIMIEVGRAGSTHELMQATYLSNAIQMIRDYCVEHNYDLWGAYEEKMSFNAVRKDHTHEARIAAGGKQF